jgi:hypothetical protein
MSHEEEQEEQRIELRTVPRSTAPDQREERDALLQAARELLHLSKLVYMEQGSVIMVQQIEKWEQEASRILDSSV